MEQLSSNFIFQSNTKKEKIEFFVNYKAESKSTLTKMKLALLALTILASSTEGTRVTYNSHTYELVGEEYAGCYSEAVKHCESLGGYLAQVDGEDEKNWLSHAVTVDSYIQSWNGDSYTDNCIVIASGTESIVIGARQCDGPHGFVCEFDGEYY